ncbi:hypothetical protein C1A50_1180 [Paenibacillus polymyxa]|nr:hypothetical protein C1A50_1180 [Paenibacillus polymyxa]
MLDVTDHYPYHMVTYNIMIWMQLLEYIDDKYGKRLSKKLDY